MAPPTTPWYGSLMPLDPSRPSRPPRATPAPSVEDPPELIAELLQQVKDIDEGREIGIPLEEALLTMFKPYTPEELSQIEKSRERRASR